MPDDLGFYYEIADAIGKKFRGFVGTEKDRKGNKRRVIRTYQVVGVRLTHARIEFTYSGRSVMQWLSLEENHCDPRVRPRTSRVLPDYNPRIDEVDSPFSIVRD